MKGNLKNSNLIFRLMCILLTVTSFTCIALAKYMSSIQKSNNIGVDNLHCSVSVLQLDTTDTVPFFNMPYIINDVVMNYPQEVNFLINNCDLKEDGTYSEPSKVDLRYEMVFYIPREFASISALQISKKNDMRDDVAVTPLYLLEDFVNKDAVTGATVDVKGEFSKEIDVEVENEGVVTIKKVVVDYGSLVYGEDETFTLQKGTDVWQWSGDKNTTILIEEVQKDAKLHYVFQTFSHNPENSDSVTRHAPVYVDKPFNGLEFYKVRISRPEFVLKNSVKQDCNYTLRITSTGQMDGASDHQDVPFGTYYSDFETNYLNENCSLMWEGKPCTVTKINEEDGGMWTITNGEKTETLYIDMFIQKNFPVRLNAIFTQTQII